MTLVLAGEGVRDPGTYHASEPHSLREAIAALAAASSDVQVVTTMAGGAPALAMQRDFSMKM